MWDCRSFLLSYSLQMNPVHEGSAKKTCALESMRASRATNQQPDKAITRNTLHKILSKVTFPSQASPLKIHHDKDPFSEHLQVKTRGTEKMKFVKFIFYWTPNAQNLPVTVTELHTVKKQRKFPVFFQLLYLIKTEVFTKTNTFGIAQQSVRVQASGKGRLWPDFGCPSQRVHHLAPKRIVLHYYQTQGDHQRPLRNQLYLCQFLRASEQIRQRKFLPRGGGEMHFLSTAAGINVPKRAGNANFKNKELSDLAEWARSGYHLCSMIQLDIKRDRGLLECKIDIHDADFTIKPNNRFRCVFCFEQLFSRCKSVMDSVALLRRKRCLSVTGMQRKHLQDPKIAAGLST